MELIRTKIQKRTGIAPSNYIPHMTLAFQLKDMKKAVYEKFYKILKEVQHVDLGEFVLSQMDLKQYSFVNTLGSQAIAPGNTAQELINTVV